VFASVSMADTILWDEASDGDLGVPASPTAINPFAAGTNIIRGTLGPNDSEDQWTSQLAAGLVIVGAEVETFSGDLSIASVEDVAANSLPTNRMLVSPSGIGTESLAVDVGSLPFSFPTVFGFTLSSTLSAYEVRVFVRSADPVPEPGTFVLFGVAALGYGVYRRRRKAS